MSKRKRNRNPVPNGQTPPPMGTTESDGRAAGFGGTTRTRAGRRWTLVAVLVVVAVAVATHFGWQAWRTHDAGVVATTVANALPATSVASASAEYVGGDACMGCHQPEATAWRTSQHAKAMQHAGDDSVLGDFNDARFTYNGVTTRFFRRGDEFWVNTDGADGKLADFKLSYTFGVDPLQQYLVVFPDGRLQALGIAWDSRPKAQGGQRWFHLYPGEKIDSSDELHWTGHQQNWNYMCADCHSTDLQRNYDTAKDTYATTWKDISVGCEACHGPGSRHVAWAKAGDGANDREATGDAHKGLAITLTERDMVSWIPVPETGNARRSRPRDTETEIQTCAVCHSRRAPISTAQAPTGNLLDTHVPSLLTEDLYFDDGQQKDEVFIHGSFLQSKMHAAGVTCSDCHDPHTSKLRLTGNATCTQCHAPTKYDTASHHHHETAGVDATPRTSPAAASHPRMPQGDGTQCVDCHMPERTYMVIDPRRDHGLRIPRPDLSVALGTPNACQSCHADKSDRWAADAVARWNGAPKDGFQHWAKALHAARTSQPDAPAQLSRLFNQPETPGIVRATALTELRRYPGRELLSATSSGLADADPLVRIAALEALADMPPPNLTAALPLASDPLRAVRAQAGLTLAGLPADQVPAMQRASVDEAMDTYRSSQQAVGERAEAHLNLGLFAAHRGDAMTAEREYKLALRRNARFVPAYVNLSDLYRATGREAEAASMLEDGLRAAPGNASLLHAAGLQRVREGKSDEAMPLLRQAVQAAPNDTRYAYVLAVALHSKGDYAGSVAELDRALAIAPSDRDLLFARMSFAQERGDGATASHFASQLMKVAPDDPRVQQLQQQMQPRPHPSPSSTP